MNDPEHREPSSTSGKDAAAAPGGPTGEPGPAPDYTEAGVPSLDHVRDKIEGRYARSLGATELAEETEQAQSSAEQQAEREKAGRERLEQIRRSLRADG
ncbi:hypothetical protein [Pseudonocardia sp. H11422]|uniref:hypothetical protein n=1 Tax=Pseudonocardia sp. H11422 TaxID=2835866 RepID=UPI002028699C|nr:hypothetical protein [Pseudonocardia sp. H11422]